MDNFKKFTKEELIAKLESQTHLEDSIKSKDKLINDLKTQHEEELAKLKKEYASKVLNSTNENITHTLKYEEELAGLKKQHEIKMQNKEAELRDIKKVKEELENSINSKLIESKKNNDKEFEARVQSAVEALKTENEELRKYGARRERELSQIMTNHGSLLKVLQGATDMGIALNEFMYNEYSRKGVI